jgi:predicted DNA-binding protein
VIGIEKNIKTNFILLFFIRLKKDMIQKMNQVASEFRRASNKQMAETTKRTINENARIEQTVNDMEDVSTRIHNENEHIEDGVG